MESNSQEKEKEDDYNDEDNMGRDNYFMLERKDDSLDSDSNEESLSKTIPNINEYLKNNLDDEVKENVDNPPINVDNNIININIEDNVNGEDNNIEGHNLWAVDDDLLEKADPVQAENTKILFKVHEQIRDVLVAAGVDEKFFTL